MIAMLHYCPGARARKNAKLLIAASLLCCAVASRAQSMIGQRAPEFERHNLSGQTIDLDSLRGKVVLLNFWATWCAPCQTEMPVFNLWQSKFGVRGFAVIGISMDDDEPSVRRLVERMKIAYPITMGDAMLGSLYGKVLGLPKTFLIGRDGRIVYQFQGETDLRVMEARVKEALAKP
jgi:cytochrome c biogenesis protein CcmG, thiol:disulfide interchange protein DsbE